MSTPAGQSQTAAVPKEGRGRLLRRWVSELGPLVALAVVFAGFALAERALSDRSVFATSDNIRTMLVNSSVVGICALGMTVVIIAGGIDLSVGTGIALCATVLATGLLKGLPPITAAMLTLLVGMLLGAFNGLLVSLLRVVPFIVTLGTMTIYLGAAKLLATYASNAQTVRPNPETQVPAALLSLLSTRNAALWPTGLTGNAAFDGWYDYVRHPAGIWWGLQLAVCVALLLRYTIFGRYVYALGSNEATARLCGVNVPLNRIAVYAVCGLFVGLAGIYQFSRLSSGNPTSGLGLELKIIAAVVIGGGSLSGGRGSVLGTLAGAAMMSVISSGCTQLELSNDVQDIIIGAVIIAAVSLDQWRQRRGLAG